MKKVFLASLLIIMTLAMPLTASATGSGWYPDLTIQFDTHSGGATVKKVSILGDSYSTFAGYLPEGNASWYSESTTDYYGDNDVTAVTQTWWSKFLTANSGSYELLVNNSYSGSTICNTTISPMAESTSFINRASALASGGTDPDVILIFGGTNDWWNTGNDMGNYQYSDWSASDLYKFRPGLAYLINNIKTTYTSADVWFIVNDMITGDVYNSIMTVCQHYSVPVISPQGIAKGSMHPTEAGMQTIADAVTAALVSGTYGAGDSWIFYENTGYTSTTFTQSDYNPNIYVIDGFTCPTLDPYNGFSAYIGNSAWTEGYRCGTASDQWTTLGYLGSYFLTQSATTAANYITAMTAGKKYRLLWDKVRHELSVESGEDEGDTWYVKVGDTYTALTATGTANEYAVSGFTVTADNDLTFRIVPSNSDVAGYAYNEAIYSLGTYTMVSTGGYSYDRNVTASAAWSNAWCKAMTSANTYKLTWNKKTHRLTIAIDDDDDAEPTAGTIVTDDGVTYTTYSDGHALAVADDYLRGGDISMLNYVEGMGAKFYDAGNNEKDPLDIMQENGVNIVRLRLYNNPGTSVTYYTGSNGNTANNYKLPADYLGEDDVLNLALRAKKHGMKIELTFHYSDFWTNGNTQIKPSEWEGYNFNQLKQAVYDYTYQFLQKMNAQGTTPDYVSLGNEIQGGLLFGYYNGDGSSTSIQKAQINSVNGYCDNMANVAALLSQGSSAVRSACPGAKVVIHLTMSSGDNAATYKWFFDEMKANSLDYDVIGASYYPYWTNQKPTMLNDFANTLYTDYGKPTLIMETGYSWTQYRPSGRYGGNYEGQLELNGTAYNEATKAGQKTFMQELQAVVKGNDHILGYLYWDPVMVEQQVNSSWIKTTWAMKKSGNTWYEDGNLVGNTTWFDYEGKLLDVFEAIAEDAVSVPATKTINGYTYTVESEAPFTLTMTDAGYSTFYDAAPRLIADGLTAYTATQSSATSLSLNTISAANIPANTGVVLKGDEGTYYLWPRRNDEGSVSDNMLKGTVLSQTIEAETGSNYYYKLANDGTNGIGWYWGAAEGGVFTNEAHKAYLVLPQSFAGARSFIGLFGSDATGINSLTSSLSPNSESRMYSLSGQRVASMQKGRIYIVNGKKLLARQQ